ncbi:MAG: J domain-containing protein [Sandaracinaceae bacterium]|nr:J domain-containing protein [Sandaracinaceae bacterium]
MREGRVVAMRVLPDDGDFLGDALRRMGAWDERVHGLPDPGELVGKWAARVGAASAQAISHALRKQLQRRMARLLGVDPPELRLTAGSSDVGVPALDEPPKTAELIVSALRERADDVPLLWARRRLGDSLVVLTPLGKELVSEAVLWPDEAAMISLLERGAPADVLVQATKGSARALRLLYALRQVGACAPPEARGGYSMLLRKTRQVRQAARAAELLELPNGSAPQDARKALRKLAAAVHPDRFGTSAPAAIRSASHQVMSALVRAQNDLR